MAEEPQAVKLVIIMTGEIRMNKSIPPKIENAVKEFFLAQSGIRLVFLFGSVVQGRLTSESDIDTAVLFETSPDALEIHRMAQSIAETLKREVDLVDLNQASPILRMQVLKNGILILCSDLKHYSEFFTSTIKQYEDLKRIRRPIEENILIGRIYA